MTDPLIPELVETEVEVPERNPHLVPWITVGAIAVAAIVASILVVTFGRAENIAPTADPKPSTSQTASPSPSKDPSTSPSPTETPKTDDVPVVTMGPSQKLAIEPWGVQAQLSNKFGSSQYVIDAQQNLVLSSPLIEKLPDSCAAMRKQFGITKGTDGKYVVLRPGEKCAQAPELYDEIWGQLAETVKTIKPL